MQCLQALIGRITETGADCIEDAERLNLTTVSLLINDNRRVDVCTVLLPVGNLLVNEKVLGAVKAPFGHVS